MVYRGILETVDKSLFQTPYLFLLFTNPTFTWTVLITQLYFRYSNFLKIERDFRDDQERSASTSEERQEYDKGYN